MDINSATDTDYEEHSKVEETDDSCRFEFIEIVPLTACTDGCCATECVNGDLSAEAKQEHLADVKQEPDCVCCIIYVIYSSLFHQSGSNKSKQK